jgi:hypothetical protein
VSSTVTAAPPVPPLPTVTETVEVKLDAKNIILTKAPPPPADPPFLLTVEGPRIPEPPPPPAPHISTITKLAPDGLVHVPEDVKVWRFAPGTPVTVPVNVTL